MKPAKHQQEGEMKSEPPTPLGYHAPEPRKSRALIWIVGAITLAIIIVGLFGLGWVSSLTAPVGPVIRVEVPIEAVDAEPPATQPGATTQADSR